MRSSSNSPPPGLCQRLDRLVGELNVLLAALAIGIACLDFVVFATITLSHEILGPRQGRETLALFDSSGTPTARADPRRVAP